MIASNHSNNVIINVLLVILEKITGRKVTYLFDGSKNLSPDGGKVFRFSRP